MAKWKSIEVTIEGTNPVLQHRFSDDFGVKKSTRKVHIEPETPREQATKVAYQHKDGILYMPSVAIKGSIVNAAREHKQTGSRRSMRYVVPQAVRITSETVPLLAKDRKTPVNTFEVDSRPVTIPATKGRIMRHRPRIDEWTARFMLRVNEELLDTAFVRKLLQEAGENVGIGDFRPEKMGEYGTFDVVEWNPVENIEFA